MNYHRRIPSRSSDVSRSKQDNEKIPGIMEPLTRFGWHHAVIIILILICGAYLRFSELPHSTVGTDEAEKYFSVEEFREGKFWVDLEHPPLEKYLIMASVSIFGDEDWAIKLPNVIIGSLIPFALFLVAARIGKNPWVGHTAAAIGALSPMLIGYSLIAKEDTLVNFSALLSILFLSVSIQYESGKDEVSENPTLRSRMHPRNLDGYALTGAIIAGLTLASKYTFAFYGISVLFVIFLMDKTWIRRKGSAFLTVMIGTFLVLSWYYLNPYWLGLGIGHWLWESATGHSTYFLGDTFTYPPPWFYPVTFIGRVAPLISFGGSIAILFSFLELPWKKDEKDHEENRKNGISEMATRIGTHMRKEPLRWMVFSWIVIVFIIMTLLPFKGIRYVQWIILPLIVLTSYFVSKLLARMSEKRSGIASFGICVILMIPALSIATPHYKEVIYFLDEDSGMMDLDGQGFSEAFEYLEDNGFEGKVSVRWEKLASYYWENTTGPCKDVQELEEKNVSFILIYRADTNRGIEPKFTELARGYEEIFVYDRDGYEILWLYKVNIA